jgi:hypothetical protein
VLSDAGGLVVVEDSQDRGDVMQGVDARLTLGDPGIGVADLCVGSVPSRLDSAVVPVRGSPVTASGPSMGTSAISG